MYNVFELFTENPIWIPVIILLIISVALSVFKKKPAQQSSSANTRSTGGDISNSEIGDVDKTEVVYGYYRYQNDNQIVIKRSEEQQRIFEEYFVVKNIKTTTCESALKKKAKVLQTVSTVLAVLGIALAAFGFITYRNAIGIVGIVAVVAAIVCKIIASQLMKKFEASIKVSVAPKKLMTDAEYEQLVDEKIESMNIAQLGLEKLGLDPEQVKEINPIVLRDKVINNTSLTVRNRDDHTVHSSTQHVTYLYFTDDQLFVYKIQFDMCCNMQDEWASEFFYKDICDVSSHTSRNVLKVDDFEFEYSTVSFNIIASNSQIGFDLDGDNENVDSIQAMKQKIREKKAQ